MDADRFDTLIRTLTSRQSRRGLLAALPGGLLGTLPLTLDNDSAFAKANHRYTAARSKCRKLKQTCKRGGSKNSKFPCCDRVHRLECDTVGFSQRTTCCYGLQQLCSGASGECCRDLQCGPVGLDGLRCCAPIGSTCTSIFDCCNGLPCTDGFCVQPPPPPPAPSCVINGQFCPPGCTQTAPCPGCCSGFCDANLTCDLPN